MASVATEDDEYEYEYDPVETETFLVDVDLSSVNDVIKSRTPGIRKALQKSSQKGTSSKLTKPVSLEQPLTQDGEPAEVLNDDDNPEHDKGQDPDSTPKTPQHNEETERGPFACADIQILEFHSANPIISYQDQIYSCTWSDMIGTNLFFSELQDTPTFSLRESEANYDMLGTTRIKLVGHKAKVTQKSGTRKRGRPVNDDDDDDYPEAYIDEDKFMASGRSLGNLRYSNAKVNADIKRQARFLEEFMDVKRAKGETDNVRTIVTKQIILAANGARRENRAKNVEEAGHKDEVEQLNRRVVRGDTDALMRLQQIYSALEEDNDTEELP